MDKGIFYIPLYQQKKDFSEILDEIIATIKFVDQKKFGDFKLKKILSADNVFVTGTAAEIQTVRKIKNKNYKIESKIIKLIKDNYNKIKLKSPLTTSKI